MKPDDIIKMVDYIKKRTDHNGDIFINVNAIPKEWIKKYIDKVDIEDFGTIYLSPSGSIRKMLEDWEKENADL